MKWKERTTEKIDERVTERRTYSKHSEKKCLCSEIICCWVNRTETIIRNTIPDYYILIGNTERYSYTFIYMYLENVQCGEFSAIFGWIRKPNVTFWHSKSDNHNGDDDDDYYYDTSQTTVEEEKRERLNSISED